MIFKGVRPEGPRSEAGDFQQESVPHLDTLYRYAVVFAEDTAQAESWVGDAYHEAYSTWLDREPDATVRVWLLRILREIVAAAHRRKGGATWEAATDTSDRMAIPDIQKSDPRGDFFKLLRSEEILSALKRLPHEISEAVFLRDIEGLGYTEIAEISAATVGTVRSRLFRGRRLLQQELYRAASRMVGHQPRAASPTEP